MVQVLGARWKECCHNREKWQRLLPVFIQDFHNHNESTAQNKRKRRGQVTPRVSTLAAEPLKPMVTLRMSTRAADQHAGEVETAGKKEMPPAVAKVIPLSACELGTDLEKAQKNARKTKKRPITGESARIQGKMK